MEKHEKKYFSSLLMHQAQCTSLPEIWAGGPGGLVRK